MIAERTTTQKPGLTMRQAAIILNVHPKRIYKLAELGQIKTYRGVDSRMMVSPEEVYLYQQNHAH